MWIWIETVPCISDQYRQVHIALSYFKWIKINWEWQQQQISYLYPHWMLDVIDCVPSQVLSEIVSSSRAYGVRMLLGLSLSQSPQTEDQDQESGITIAKIRSLSDSCHTGIMGITQPWLGDVLYCQNQYRLAQNVNGLIRNIMSKNKVHSV